MFRLRITDEAAEVHVKSHPDVQDGSTCRFADSQTLTKELAAEAVGHPNKLMSLCDGTVAALKKEHELKDFKYLGGFRTTRESYLHDFKAEKAMVVKLDSVEYPFGAAWELEVACGGVPVHDVIEELRALLDKAGIMHCLGRRTKFQTFVEGCKQNMMSGALRPKDAPKAP